MLLLVLTIAELVATICLVMSKRQVKSKLVIPRLALIAVQLALAVLVCLLLIIYFSGAAQSINNVVLDIYEVSSFLLLLIISFLSSVFCRYIVGESGT